MNQIGKSIAYKVVWQANMDIAMDRMDRFVAGIWTREGMITVVHTKDPVSGLWYAKEQDDKASDRIALRR